MVHHIHLESFCSNLSESLGHWENYDADKCAPEPPVSCCELLQLVKLQVD